MNSFLDDRTSHPWFLSLTTMPTYSDFFAYGKHVEYGKKSGKSPQEILQDGSEFGGEVIVEGGGTVTQGNEIKGDIDARAIRQTGSRFMSKARVKDQNSTFYQRNLIEKWTM
ncbi:unnamed protein product [Clonostachys byssicola]|uniref:Uncharacterized protein n=1 Tax=Clonostachys byssicola TaxID=160290 RepID=A0A9N9Y866_9HYPO|nr:unnamed protein product [Clonostachys byssicola]